MSGAPYWSDDTVTVYHGDCLQVLAGMPDGSVDAVVTDPPYGLEFMGREWDAPWRSRDTGVHAEARTRRVSEMSDESKRRYIASGVNAYAAGRPFQAWCERWAVECLRVLKPGGHLIAFGGTRTWHRLACAIEDAGFEVRDSIAWLYGSGFPKSLDVSKAIDKAAGAVREVKPWLPKVSSTTNTDKAQGGMTGNVQCPDCSKWKFSPDPCRCPRDNGAQTPAAQQWQGWGTALKPAFEPIVVARKPLAGTVAANVLQWGTGALNIDGCRTAHADAADLATSQAKNPGRLDVVSSDVYGAGRPQQSVNTAGRWPTNVVLDGSQAAELDRQSGTLKSGDLKPYAASAGDRVYGHGLDAKERSKEYIRDGDAGGASRFFPTFRYEAKAPTVERPREDGTAHPTVKPLDLMRWLVRLVCPPGGVVLDPFAGSGTTAEACVIEGARCVTIEREAAYLPLIVARLSKPIQPDLFGLDA